MIQFAYRDPRLARMRWLVLVGLGSIAAVASFVPFAGTVRDPAVAAEPAALALLFLGSLVLLAVAVAGYTRARRQEERERARAAEGADD